MGDNMPKEIKSQANRNIYDWNSNLTYDEEKECLSNGYHVFHFYSGKGSLEKAIQQIATNQR